tara:strand:- start:137 stop:619 length:483 start_codon:yes stop_codon:yes gene_type:complete
MTLRRALDLADAKNLDLVEVAPGSKPPVCRLLDYGKFRYKATRKEREARKSRKSNLTNEVKEIRFKTRIGEHDRSSKIRMIKRILSQGNKVKVSVMFRGREMMHPDIGMKLLRSVAEDLIDDALLDKPPLFEGRNIYMILAPVINTDKSVKTKELNSAQT